MLRDLFRRLLPRDATQARSDGDHAIEAANELIAQGRRAESDGDLINACERYREAVARAPMHPQAHLNLGIGLESTGDAAGAQKCYEKVLEIEPGNPYAS